MSEPNATCPSRAFRDDLAACRELSDLFPPLRRACNECRIEHFNVAFRSPVFNRQSRFITLTSFPEAVHRAYEERGYLVVDPIIKRSSSTHQPIQWDELDWNESERSQALRRLYSEAGLSFGISVPLRGAANQFAIFTLAGRTCPVESGQLAEFIDRVRTLAALLFDRLLELPEMKQSNGEVGQLTEREVEFLRLSALGYPLKKIHAFMNIKQSTATYFTNRIVAKLGAKRLRMAIIQAQLNGLIDLVGFPERIVGTHGWYHESTIAERRSMQPIPEPVGRYLPTGARQSV